MTDIRFNFKHDVIEICVLETESDDFKKFLDEIKFYDSKELDLRLVKVEANLEKPEQFSDPLTSGATAAEDTSDLNTSGSSEDFISCISPGSGIVAVTSHWEKSVEKTKFSQLDDINAFLKRNQARLFDNWSIGCLSEDRSTRVKYVITTHQSGQQNLAMSRRHRLLLTCWRFK